MGMHGNAEGAAFLDRIVERRRIAVEESKLSTPATDLKARIADREPTRGFRDAVASGGHVTVIAELKKASPSRGVIREDFRPVQLARCFEENGAAAVSVLTEPDFFLGRDKFLTEVHGAVGLPVLRKDFVFDPYQIYEARALGADAVLLITRIIAKGLLEELIGIAHAVGLDPLTEVHSEEELGAALSAGTDLIGINNRDLETFITDLTTSIRLGALVPGHIPTVAMSGIRGPEDIERLGEAGVRSVLIGEALMRIADVGDIGRTLSGLIGKKIRPEGGRWQR